MHESTDQQGGSRKKEKMSTHDLWTLPAGDRIVVEFNSMGQAIKRGSMLLIWYINTVATDTVSFPIFFHSWDKIPEDNKWGCYRNKIQVIDYALFFNYFILTFS